MTSPRQAYRLVRIAIKNGRLVRASSCERCGKPDRPASDGRSTIHAHHKDYSKPLDVEWICAKCHREETPLSIVAIEARNFVHYSGSRNHQARLTEDDVLKIWRSKKSQPALAEEFGVHNTAISRIKRGVTWGWLTSAADGE